ncbi:MAG TPA: A24 family peptidase [Pirellulaceae bacterium]|nr:A24 family peptidase [Pirellulaceae bacterium]
MSSVQLLATLVSIFVITAAILDFRTKKIPNWITVPAFLAALLFHAVMPDSRGILWSLAGFGVGFSLLIVPWLLGGGGMGDVKLLAALGAWLGPLMILAVFGASAVLAACMAAGVMVGGSLTHGITAARSRYLNLDRGGAATAAGSPRAKPRRVIPFAVPIAISTLLVLGMMVIQSLVQH